MFDCATTRACPARASTSSMSRSVSIVFFRWRDLLSDHPVFRSNQERPRTSRCRASSRSAHYGPRARLQGKESLALKRFSFRLDSSLSEVPSILRPSESISASVDIKAAKDAPSSDMRFTAAKLQRLLSGSAMDLTPPPSTSLYLSTLNANADSRSSSSPLTLPLLLAIKTKRKLAALSQAYPLITQSDARHIFPLFEPRDLDIVVHWKMPAEGRSGALILPTAVIGPHESIFLGLDDEEAGGRVIRSMFEATDVAKKGDRLSTSRRPCEALTFFVLISSGCQCPWRAPRNGVRPCSRRDRGRLGRRA